MNLVKQGCRQAHQNIGGNSFSLSADIQNVKYRYISVSL